LIGFKKVKEGLVEIFAPDVKIPEEGKKYGFYNPRMKMDRDISVAILSVFKDKFRKSSEISICDLMGGTGIRGIRYKKEVGGNVVINDINKNSVELIKKNVLLNSLDIKVESEEARFLLHKYRSSKNLFDFIDLDPFGSPATFIDSVAICLKDFSLVGVTATDTSLFGLYPKTCLRKYGVISFKSPFYRELGTRILLSFLIREFARFGKALQPILSYSILHYIRIYAISKNSIEECNKVLDKFKDISEDMKRFRLNIGKGINIYCGELHNKNFLLDVSERLKEMGSEGIKITNLASTELDNLFYFDIAWEAKKNKIRKMPSLNKIIEILLDKGYDASRTIFCSTGIKTSADIEVIQEILKD